MGQPQAALETLHEVVTSRRFRVWQQSYQKIMMRHVDLCVELKKGEAQGAPDPSAARHPAPLGASLAGSVC